MFPIYGHDHFLSAGAFIMGFLLSCLENIVGKDVFGGIFVCSP